MNKKSFRQGDRTKGMVMIATVFLLLVLLPITIVFVRWVGLHRQGTTLSRARLREYYACISSANIARYRIQHGDTPFPWGSAGRTDSIELGDGTTISVETSSITTP